MNRIKLVAALGSLVLVVFLCGCNSGRGEELLLVGEEDTEYREETANLAPEEGRTEQMEETSVICVYVCGAVVTPGVYELPEGSRVLAALEAAGGFTDTAGRETVNLAARIEDGEKVYFPEEDEVLEAGSTAGQQNGKININTADVAALTTLPGIGDSRAMDIIRYRETAGKFKTCEDIKKVSGIKDSVFNKICDKITVE